MVGPPDGRTLLAVLNIGAVPLLWLLDLFLSWDRSSHPPGLGAELVPLLSLPAYLPLLWRRRRPLLVLVLTTAGSLALAALVPRFVPLMGVWLALYVVARRCEWRRAVAGLVIAAAPVVVNVAAEMASVDPGERSGAFIVAGLLGVMVILAIFAVGRWVNWSVAQRVLVARLAAAEAAAQERARIAREMHDVVAHSVSLMLLQAAGAEHVLRTDPERARTALKNVDDLGQQAIAELRRMLRLLTGPDPDQEPGQGPPDAGPRFERVQELVGRLRQAGFAVDFDVHGSPRPLDPGVDAAAYRIVQEALTNTAKYADPGRPVKVEISWAAGEVRVLVVNDGVRDPAAGPVGGSTGHGVAGMHERAKAAGGTVTAAPTSGGGYSVRAVLPTAT